MAGGEQRFVKVRRQADKRGMRAERGGKDPSRTTRGPRRQGRMEGGPNVAGKNLGYQEGRRIRTTLVVGEQAQPKRDSEIG